MTALINASTSSGVVITPDTSGSLAFQTASTTAVTIDSSQNVGIGGDPVKKLSVIPTSIRRMDFYVRDPGVDDALVIRSQHASNNNIRDMIIEGSFLRFYTGADSGSAGSEAMRIDSSGNLLINTTSIVKAGRESIVFNGAAQQGIAIRNSNSNDSCNYLYFLNSADNPAGSIQQTGTSTTSYVTSSDYRLKENVQPMTGALNKVSLLKPVTYTWKDDGKDGQGFIAHELQEVVPDAVCGQKDAVDADGKIIPQGIDTSFLVATLTAAIQELKSELDVTKTELAALKDAI